MTQLATLVNSTSLKLLLEDKPNPLTASLILNSLSSQLCKQPFSLQSGKAVVSFSSKRIPPCPIDRSRDILH
ncbi:hypothetical protein L596_009869 [Steinernema carpocapsae]|uniref:Uncharacterized protein n=1 Tax=Steinernema carpocapsae TaxID=34508 RepID=A0A4U5PGL6_STECR|nr:hypothetical protein L596_009869 [Steinernema carpocapsae]